MKNSIGIIFSYQKERISLDRMNRNSLEAETREAKPLKEKVSTKNDSIKSK